jgi:hypothetical protein
MTNGKNTDHCNSEFIITDAILGLGAVVVSIVLSGIVTGFNTVVFVTNAAESHIQAELAVTAYCVRTGEYTKLRAGSASISDYAVVDCTSVTDPQLRRTVVVNTTDLEAILMRTSEQEQCHLQWLMNMSNGPRDTVNPLSSECLKYLANR